jgi:RimJ/RimL family protein N-acetyltransferase
MMSNLRKLSGDACYLAPCSVEDAEAWARWDNDLQVAMPLGGEAYTLYPVEKERQILRDIIDKQSPVFNIVLTAGDKLIGRCMLLQVDQVNRTAMLGMAIGEKQHWSRGYGIEATKLLLDYAFNLLNLNSVMIGVFSFNKRAIRCYEKAGFKEIARRRQARMIGPQVFDIVYMDILAGEFESGLVRDTIEQ